MSNEFTGTDVFLTSTAGTPAFMAPEALKGGYKMIITALDKRECLLIIRDIFLLILHKNICCDPSSEPSR